MLTSEIVQKVKQIQIRTGKQVADVLAGEYLSVFKGRGMEFDEVRPYVPGDDVRTIDWNVTARMGEPYVKRYVEERELTVLLVVDVSPSQDFGSRERSKREAAAEMAALLALSAIQNDDKIGLLLFHGAAEVYIPPRKGQKHALRVIREVLARGDEGYDKTAWGKDRWRLPRLILERFLRLKTLTGRAAAKKAEQDKTAADRRRTNIHFAMEFCQKVMNRRAVIFLVSDFIDAGYTDVLRTVNRKHDVVAVQVTDEREENPVDAGLITLEDAETGGTQVVDTSSRAFRELVKRRAAGRREELTNTLRSAGVDLITVDATQSVIDPLIGFFRTRQRRMRR